MEDLAKSAEATSLKKNHSAVNRSDIMEALEVCLIDLMGRYTNMVLHIECFKEIPWIIFIDHASSSFYAFSYIHLLSYIYYHHHRHPIKDHILTKNTCP